MNKKTKELCEMIKNADPFHDEFWNEVLSEQVDEFVSNFSKKDWTDVVSILSVGNREKDYCLLETILGACKDDGIVASAIEKMVDVICQDDDFLWMVFMQGEILKLNLSEEVISKLKKACSKKNQLTK